MLVTPHLELYNNRKQTAHATLYSTTANIIECKSVNTYIITSAQVTKKH